MRLGKTTLSSIPQGEIIVTTKTHEEYQKDIKIIKKSQQIKIKIHLTEIGIKNFLISFGEAANIIKKKIINHYNPMLYMSFSSLKLYLNVIGVHKFNEYSNLPFLHTYNARYK